MANIKIHWQKMQFHKSLSISVTTSCWTWWMIEVNPAPWYSLSELPPWTTIARDVNSSTIFYLYYWWQSICNISAIWEAEMWYAFEGCTINRWWDKFIVSTTPIELENWDVIWFTFEQVNTVLWFYSDSIWQWYDSNNNIVSGAKLPVWLYTISSFTQATSNSYALTISWNSTYTYYYKWSFPITIDYIEINWSQESIPYPIVSWDYLRVKYTEIPWVTLASETQFWKWVNYNTWEEITFIPAKANVNSISFAVVNYGYDSKSIVVRPKDWADITDDIMYKCVDDGIASDVEITNVYEDYWWNKIYYDSTTFIIPVWYGIYWRMDIIGATLTQPSASSSDLLQDIVRNVPCLSAQQEWDIQPQPSYLFEDRMTWYLCWFFTTNNLRNTGFAVVIFDRSAGNHVIDACCYSYSGNVYWITSYDFMSNVQSVMQGWGTMDYNNLQRHNMPLYSNTQLIDEVMHEFHIR